LVWLRLTELECRADAFERAGQKLIARAKRHNDLIGRHVHLDGTAFTTYARAIHDCPDAQACTDSRQRARGGELRVPRELVRGSAEQADAVRQDAAETPEDEVGLDPVADFGISWLDLQDPRLADIPLSRRQRYRWFEQIGHIYRVADTTAGARLLEPAGVGRTGKFHFGGELMMASDDHFHAPLSVLTQPADVQEYEHYEPIYAKTAAAVGDPYSMTVDRGLHIKRVFQHNLRHRVSTICDWRQPKAATTPNGTSAPSLTVTASRAAATAATPATTMAPGSASS